MWVYSVQSTYIRSRLCSESRVNIYILLQIVYVAPMKALAAEMVRNFGRRLAPLGVSVRELTGDMQLTKSEIQQTQVRGKHK